LLVLEPIFEADFLDCSHGFRPGRSAHGALREIQGHLSAGYCAVYDADLKGYFDSIPHDRLMACLRTRISDGQMLKLIRMWLETPVIEPGEKGGPPRVSRPEKGTPQGGVISPLLANLYLHGFDVVFHREGGPARWAKAKLVRYADDFVVMARYIDGRMTGWIEYRLEEWLGLEINREKTRVAQVREPGASLDFLGYTFRYDRSQYGGGKRYLNVFASKKAVKRERAKLHEMTGARMGWKPVPRMVEEMNEHLRGWANYFGLGYPRKTFGQINRHARQRLRQHLNRRSQRKYRRPEGTTYYAHFKKLGLVQL
jgi:RNA-directed DNA polymerase